MEKLNNALTLAIESAAEDPIPVIITCKNTCVNVARHLARLEITDIQTVEEINVLMVSLHPADIRNLSEMIDVESIELDAEIRLD